MTNIPTKAPGLLRASGILWQKHMLKFFRNGEELFGTMIQPILWVGLFGLGMGGLANAGGMAGQGSYIGFMLPGIMALSLLGGAIGGGMAWLDERSKGIAKAYMAAPIPRASIVAGNLGSTISKGIIQGLIILLVGTLMGARLTLAPAEIILALVLLLFFAVGFGGIALSMASATEDLMAYHVMIMLLNLPILFLSNALYPVDSMPKWMQTAIKINPATYLVDGLRQTILQSGSGTDTIPLPICLAVTAGFAFLGFLLARGSINKQTRRK
jgi:ABC-2 type transport system permease protein